MTSASRRAVASLEASPPRRRSRQAARVRAGHARTSELTRSSGATFTSSSFPPARAKPLKERGEVARGDAAFGDVLEFFNSPGSRSEDPLAGAHQREVARHVDPQAERSIAAPRAGRSALPGPPFRGRPLRGTVQAGLARAVRPESPPERSRVCPPAGAPPVEDCPPGRSRAHEGPGRGQPCGSPAIDPDRATPAPARQRIAAASGARA